MIQIFGDARLGRDAELRYTPNGEPVCNLALAFNYGRKGDDGKYPTQWVEASLWGRQAEGLAPYLLKGQQLVVTVSDAHIEEYQSQGVTRSKMVGRISSISLVGGAPQQQNQQRQQPQQQQRPPAQQQTRAPEPDYDNFDDDSIPF